MWINLIGMDNECNNIFLAPFVTGESVHILFPPFDIRASFYMRVVSVLCKIHLLISENYFKHALTPTAKMKLIAVRYLGVFRPLLESLIPRSAKFSVIFCGMLLRFSTGVTTPPFWSRNWESPDCGHNFRYWQQSPNPSPTIYADARYFDQLLSFSKHRYPWPVLFVSAYFLVFFT